MMKKLLLIMSLVGTLYAETAMEKVMNAAKGCIVEKALIPERSCIQIATELSDKEPTLTSKANMFYLCATSCEDPSLYYNELEKGK